MVATRLRVDFPHPAHAPEAVELFDDEFIFSRERSISFAQRFSDVFSVPECFVAVGSVTGDLVGALLVRPFTWSEGAREWRGAMMGLVCTKPRFRRQGYAAQLLAASEARCCALDLDFGVLWAAHDGLYGRQGWMRSDRGMLGVRRAGQAGALPVPPLAAANLVRAAHALHEAREGPRVNRRLSNYRHLLPPAEHVVVIVEGDSFALCGCHDQTGYVYDIVGTGREMPGLWHRLAAHFGDIYVNVELGTGAHRWLEAHAGLAWSKQSLAMWKPLRRDSIPFAAWYVPFMDRI
ncbi:MAG: GNAT family N-acetyltransferase [Betaproteobacteria bacterium]|nr:GNAT family N-acetyltransferase [Betaproteobacteria bacterium]